ncbi:MAG: DUF4175 family protein [Rhodospirillales bacterium]|nr:DUF4175 family protein [Rhodospirillales bacterium]
MMGGRARIRYRLLLDLARVSLWIERSWRPVWPSLMVISVFAAVALLDVLPALPPWLHTTALAAFAVALVRALVQARRALRPVPLAAARYRLERDSGLRHHPLTALEDRLAAGSGDAAAEALWDRHRRSMAASVQALRAAGPRTGMAASDPRGLRYLAPLLLVIAVAGGWNEPGERLARAVQPRFAADAAASIEIDMWITPPAYTGRPPMFVHWPPPIENGSDAAETHARPQPAEVPIEVPAGSAVLAHARGMPAAPVLAVGGEQFVFTAVGGADKGDGHRAEATITGGERIAVRRRGAEVAAWPLRVVPDLPPQATFAAPPAATAGAQLSLSYAATDDYGVAGVAAVIRHGGGERTFDGEAEVRLPLPLDQVNVPATGGSAVEDLTAHAWAGAPVHIRIEAEDGGGQTGSSAEVELVLPERQFSHPVAEAVIRQRKMLIPDAATHVQWIAGELAAIAAQPDHYAHDTTVSLALAVAAARLRHHPDRAAIRSVRAILWDTALRIEDGDVPAAEARLRDARQELWEALRGDEDQAEIERLMDDLQAALDDFLAAVSAELARKGLERLPVAPDGKVMRSDDLREMIEMAREMARAGAPDRASRLLSELRNILDSLRAGMQPGQSAKDLVKAHRLMGDLTALGNDQQSLLDDTFKRSRNAETDEPGAQPGAAAGADTQEQLRRRLGGLMLEFDELLGGIPAELGKAERAMNRARGSLAAGDGEEAVRQQTEALQYLRQSETAAASALAERLGGSPGMFANDPDEYQDNPGADPFGRFSGGGSRGFGTGRVDIPDRTEVRRVEEILQELRRRAGEPGRPRMERDYIERLLRRF